MPNMENDRDYLKEKLNKQKMITIITYFSYHSSSHILIQVITIILQM